MEEDEEEASAAAEKAGVETASGAAAATAKRGPKESARGREQWREPEVERERAAQVSSYRSRPR